MQAGKTNLFNSWYTKSSTIEEFEVAQNQMTDQAGNGLRDNWVSALQVAFKSSFKDVGEHICHCQARLLHATNYIGQSACKLQKQLVTMLMDL